jgi:glutamate racemase
LDAELFIVGVFYFCSMRSNQPIGVFDSGYGGLTVLKEIISQLPDYDFIYMGDNARAPYGNRSFESVYHYSRQCVEWFFTMSCPLVILACNTASAKALRTIQQQDLPHMGKEKRVLGVIRPTTEIIGTFTRSGAVGIFATVGTVLSDSYPLEISKFFPDLRVYQQACPMWVPLIENNEHNQGGADYFIREYAGQLFAKSNDIDTVLLGCTHYPLMQDRIAQFLPPETKIISQGEIVAASLSSYLERHPDLASRCSKNAKRSFFTTDSPLDFDSHASLFFGSPVRSHHIDL